MKLFQRKAPQTAGKLITTVSALLFATFSLASAGRLNFDSLLSLSSLRQAYDAQCAALLSGDFGSLTNTMAPEYLLVTAEGKRFTREQFIANSKASAQKLHWNQCVATIRELWRTNDTLKAVVSNTGKGTVRSAQTNLEVKTAGDSIDQWRVVNGRLLEISSVDLDSMLTVAGKIVSVSRLPLTDYAPAP